MLPPRILRSSFVAFAVLLAAQAARAGAEEACQAWPGEPSPLPSVTSPDGFAARWAELRARELTLLARQAEGGDRDAAWRLWRHVDCLQPGSAEAREGLHRTARVRVFRPVLVDAPPPRNPKAAASANLAVAQLAGDVYLQARTAPDRADVEALLAQAEVELRGALYRAALATAEEALLRLEALGSEGEWQQTQRARGEVVMATAEIALGREGAARDRFARTLRRDPSFTLDPASTAPKVMRVLQAARAAQEPQP